MSLICIKNSVVTKMLQLFPYFSLNFFRDLESLFNTVLGQDCLICDDVGLCSGLNRVGYSIYDIGIGLRNIVEGIVTNNMVAPTHGAPIGSYNIEVDDGRIPYVIYFLIRS